MNKKYYLVNIFFIKLIVIIFSIFFISDLGNSIEKDFLSKYQETQRNTYYENSTYTNDKIYFFESVNKSFNYYTIAKNLLIHKRPTIVSEGDLHKAYFSNYNQKESYINFLKKNMDAVGYLNVKYLDRSYFLKERLLFPVSALSLDNLKKNKLIAMFIFFKKGEVPEILQLSQDKTKSVFLKIDKYRILFYHLIIYIFSAYFFYKSVITLKKRFFGKKLEFLSSFLLFVIFTLIGSILSLYYSSQIISLKILLIFMTTVLFKVYPKIAFNIFSSCIIILIILFVLTIKIEIILFTTLIDDIFITIFISFVLSRFFFYENKFNKILSKFL